VTTWGTKNLGRMLISLRDFIKEHKLDCPNLQLVTEDDKVISEAIKFRFETDFDDDGDTVYTLEYPIEDPDFPKYLKYLSDFSEYKRKEALIREKEKQYQTDLEIYHRNLEEWDGYRKSLPATQIQDLKDQIVSIQEEIRKLEDV